MRECVSQGSAHVPAPGAGCRARYRARRGGRRLLHVRAGMTLLELVVALAILAILTAVGGEAFATIIDREQTIRTSSTGIERAGALREMLRQWILQGEIQVQQGGGPRGSRSFAARTSQGASSRSARMGASAMSAATAGVTAATSTGNELTVVTNGPTPLMTAAVSIRVFVDADDNTPERGLTMEYRAVQQVGGAAATLYRRELDPDVGDLDIEFFDARGGRWIASTEAATGGQLIAVRITMIPVDGGTLPAMLQLPLTIVYGEAPNTP